MQFLNTDVAQGSVVTQLRSDGIVNKFIRESDSERILKNQSTFGEVMDKTAYSVLFMLRVSVAQSAKST